MILPKTNYIIKLLRQENYREIVDGTVCIEKGKEADNTCIMGSAIWIHK